MRWLPRLRLLERAQEREDDLAVLNRLDATGSIRLPFAESLDVVEDGEGRACTEKEVALERFASVHSGGSR
jgi:hypothetical protein